MRIRYGEGHRIWYEVPVLEVEVEVEGFQGRLGTMLALP